MTLGKITEWNREKSPNELTVQSGFCYNSTVMTNYRKRIADELLAYKLSAISRHAVTKSGCIVTKSKPHRDLDYYYSDYYYSRILLRLFS